MQKIVFRLKRRGKRLNAAVLKVGTKASNIRRTDNAGEIDCTIGGTAIVLRCEFVKKLG